MIVPAAAALTVTGKSFRFVSAWGVWTTGSRLTPYSVGTARWSDTDTFGAVLTFTFAPLYPDPEPVEEPEAPEEEGPEDPENPEKILCFFISAVYRLFVWGYGRFGRVCRGFRSSEDSETPDVPEEVPPEETLPPDAPEEDPPEEVTPPDVTEEDTAAPEEEPETPDTPELYSGSTILYIFSKSTAASTCRNR